MSVIWILARRLLLGTLRRPGYYVWLSALLLLLLEIDLRAKVDVVEQNSLIVLAHPLEGSLFLAALLLSLYLGFCASVHIAGERALGTLEVLFTGPVRFHHYVLSQALHHTLLFFLGLSVVGLYLAVWAQLTGFRPDPGSGWLILSHVFLGTSIIAIGLCLSAFIRRSITAGGLFIALNGLLLTVATTYHWLLQIPAERMTKPLAYTRWILVALRRWLRWISPAEYALEVSQRVMTGNPWLLAFLVAVLFFYTLALVGIAVWGLKRCGVVR